MTTKQKTKLWQQMRRKDALISKYYSYGYLDRLKEEWKIPFDKKKKYILDTRIKKLDEERKQIRIKLKYYEKTS